MSRHLVVHMFIAVLAVASLAASPAGPPPLASDPCGVGEVDGDVVVAAWLDVCDLSMTTLSPSAGGPTTLEVRLGMASTDRAAASMFSVRWNVGDCAVRLLFGDASTEHEAVSAISAECAGDEPVGYDCVKTVSAPDGPYARLVCADARTVTAIDEPIIDGDAYVWTVTFDGAVAELVGDHGHGTQLDGITVTSSNRTYQHYTGPSVLVTDGDGDSLSVGGDHMRGDAAYVVG